MKPEAGTTQVIQGLLNQLLFKCCETFQKNPWTCLPT